jgi:hypothetical protein
MPFRVVVSVLVAVTLVWLSGCGPARLNVNKTLELDSEEVKAIDLPAEPKPQKLTVEFSSSDGDVSVYVFKESDAKGEEGLVTAAANSKKALADKAGTSGSLSVDIPENTATRVIVRSRGKKTSVNLKITNQQ